jgi:hypothetical protein
MVVMMMIMVVMELKRNIGSCEPNATVWQDFVCLGNIQIILKCAYLVNILKMRIAIVLTIYDRNPTY